MPKKYGKKRCPFVTTKRESSSVWYDARCSVGAIEFKVKSKGFSVEHGCFSLAHKDCEIFLEAIKDEWWRKVLARIGYVLEDLPSP